MNYISTRNNQKNFTFKDVFLKGLADDGGLFVPKSIKPFKEEELDNLKNLSYNDLAAEIIYPFIGDFMSKDDLISLISKSYSNFRSDDVVKISDLGDLKVLELFHGPTLAFKDIALQFLGNLFNFYLEENNNKLNIIGATSGDTGGAVVSGFFNIPGIKVKILYPKGKVSKVQRMQLTTWGGNISDYEVAGTFDDWQRLVKQSFLDKDLNEVMNLSSANSINIARLIPQSFYYFYAIQQSESDHNVICVPSGNYGNLTAGLWAWSIGLPICILYTSEAADE